jgi:hypothetical protein
MNQKPNTNEWTEDHCITVLMGQYGEQYTVYKKIRNHIQYSPYWNSNLKRDLKGQLREMVFSLIASYPG